ncbi:MAG: hypothetical protein WB492_09735 [Christiangramia sp.]
MGAVINKEPNEKFGKTFLKGLGQGALGGYLVFESKRLIREFSKSGDFGYIWPSKIINSTGSSIIENAAANRDFWARWHINIGFNRIEVNAKNNFRLSYRIMPLDLMATACQAIDSRPDWELSLRTGTFVFRSNKSIEDLDFNGRAFGNSIQLLDGSQGTASLPHEIIHTYQYEQLSGFNAYFSKTEDKFASRYKLVEQYQKIFYNDYNLVLGTILFVVSDPENIGRGFAQKEAYYFGNTSSTDKVR